MSFKILASTLNKNKVREFKQIKEFAELIEEENIEILSLADFDNPPEIVEDGESFEENASKKALAGANFAEIPAFADDSGLAVEALDGAPGIKSSRYAGEDATNEERIEKLLKELKGEKNRAAKFVCVIALAFNGEILETFYGEIKGNITETAKGSNGFGYDPVFIPEGYDLTFAEMDSELKDFMSHRAVAVRGAVEFIEDELGTIDDFDF